MNKFIFLLIGILMFCCSDAQEYGHRQYDRIQKAHSDGTEFPELNLFNGTEKATGDYVKDYMTMIPSTTEILMLYKKAPKAVTLTVTAATGKQYTLEMVESHPTSEDARMGYMDETGRHRCEYDAGVHYQGALKGTQKSVATMSVFANGEVMIFFSNDDGNFNLGRMENDVKGRYVLYNSKARTKEIPFTCKTDEGGVTIEPGRSASKTTGAIECKKLRIYWECGYNYYTQKGSLTAAQNHAIALFNMMQGIYYNDGMALEMSSLYIWTAPDWYYFYPPLYTLWHFYQYWLSQDNAFYGDHAMLIKRGQEGWAYVDALCQEYRFAISCITGASNNFPNYDWDVHAVAHETGHGIGAVHTRSCSWKTGPGGSCGSIDDCYGQETNYGCSSPCPSTYLISDTTWQGTIMSYCFNRINFSAGFGPVVGAYLRGQIANTPCLRPAISPALTAKEICNNDGMVSLNYTLNNFGVSPYKYSWSNGDTTQNISGLTNSGKYTVTIIDSNNCTVSDSIEVKKIAKPGDGQALPYNMPLCCKNTSHTVTTLKATLPVELSDCQTVGWLRSTTPVTTYQDAKTIYTNAGAGDIIASDNDTAIDNNTAAMLTIKTPYICNKVTAYYYTPFVTRVAKSNSVYSGTVYSGNATNPAIIKQWNKAIGTSITIPDQASAVTGCDLLDTPTSCVFTVTVTNYTGRANQLVITIMDADNQELYRKLDHAGNGIYNIPINSNDPLQTMTLRAYDYNCYKVDSCISSSLTLLATRTVTYTAKPPLVFDKSCVVGTSVFLSFGPDSCNLGIKNVATKFSYLELHPNPATSTALLEFYAETTGKAIIYTRDIAGKTIAEEHIDYGPGMNKRTLNVAGIAKGMYFLTLKNKEGEGHTLKLLVQ